MQLNADKVKMLLKNLGFSPCNGENGIYQKSYVSHGGYSIFVDFNQEKIEYAAASNHQDFCIQVWGHTTSNFSRAENFVVLECVDRLLEKGYSPACIELEKTYPSGRGHSGRPDIFVKYTDGTPFLMIECKTWGSEYEKELNKMLRNGGQLFSYYVNDRNTKYLSCH